MPTKKTKTDSPEKFPYGLGEGSVILTKDELKKLEKLLEEGKLWNSKENFDNSNITPNPIFGQVLLIEEKTFKRGRKDVTQSYCTLGLSGGTNKVIALSTVLEKQFIDSKIKVGDKIGVKYLGDIKNYHNFVTAKL